MAGVRRAPGFSCLFVVGGNLIPWEGRMMRSVRWRSTFLAAAAFVLAFATDGAAQATGTVEGKVTETGSGRPLAGAQVFVAGTTIGSVTNDRGEYRITAAPARQVSLRVRLICYTPINKSGV